MRKLHYSILTIISFLHPMTANVLFTTKVTNDFKQYLPGDLQPEKYDLDIFTDMKEAGSQYRGTVSITVKCLRKTNKIILHLKDLLVHEKDVKIKLAGSDPPSFVPVKDHEYDLHYEQYTIILREALKKDKHYEVKIEYSRPRELGNLTLDKGYMFVVYTNDKGHYEKEVSYATMSNGGARRVFPCFDQLGMKAVFNISLGHLSTVDALSNAGKIPTEPEWDPFPYIKDKFTETVPMETSSVTLALLDYRSETSMIASLSQPNIRIFADASVFERARSISAQVVQIFQFFSNYFDIPYPFSKLDVVALPQFIYSVEVTYGVIYVSERKTLKGVEETSHSARYEIVSEICYAVSQQWIGHTVTVSRWEDNIAHIALNIFLQTQCVTEIEPKWELLYIEPEIIDSFMRVSELHLKDVFRAFLVTGNAPGYLRDDTNKRLKKVYHLTRMIHFILGQDIFQQSVNAYLEKFKFSNSLFGDLWATFTNTANTIRPHLLPNISIGEIMTSWCDQDGHPLIIVTWERETKQISIHQIPFVVFEKEEVKHERCWLIPLSYTTKTESEAAIDTSVREWLTCDKLHLNIDLKEDDWFLLDLNVNVIGRVYYADESIWVAIQKSLVNNEEPHVFHAFVRARLISDMFVFAEIGALRYEIVLDAMTYLPREDRYENWTRALREFNNIRSLLVRSRAYPYFMQYMQRLLDPVYRRAAYQFLAHTKSVDFEFKVAIIESSCRYDVEACRRESVELIKNWKRGKVNLTSVPAELRQTMLCNGIKNSNRKHWDFVWKVFKISENPLRDTLLMALGCSKSASTLNRFLERSIDKEMIPPGDTFTIFQNVCSNRKAYKVIRKFFRNNYDKIYKTGKGLMSVYRYWVELFNTTVEQEDLDELWEFAKIREVADSTNDRLQDSVRKARKNIAWLEKNENSLKKYLKSRAPKKAMGFIFKIKLIEFLLEFTRMTNNIHSTFG